MSPRDYDLNDPLSLPLAFKAWLVNYIQQELLLSQLTGDSLTLNTVAVASLTSTNDLTFVSDSDLSTAGDLIFKNGASTRARMVAGGDALRMFNLTGYNLAGGGSPKYPIAADSQLVTIDKYGNVGFGKNALIEQPLLSSFHRSVPDFWWSANIMRLGVRSMVVQEVDDPPDLTFGRFGPTAGYPYAKGPLATGTASDLCGLDTNTVCGQIRAEAAIVPYNGGVWSDATPGGATQIDAATISFITAEMARDLTGNGDYALGMRMKLSLNPLGGQESFDVVQWNAAGEMDLGRTAIQAGGRPALLNMRGDAGQNAKQTVTITGTPTGGTFTLTHYGTGLVPPGQTTAAIAYNAVAADVKSALEALGTIGAAQITATGGPLPGTPVVVEFTGTTVWRQNFTKMRRTSSLTGGTSPAVSVSHTQYGKVDMLAKDMLRIQHGGQSGDTPTGDYIRVRDPANTEIFRLKGDGGVYAPGWKSRTELVTSGTGYIAEAFDQALANRAVALVTGQVQYAAIGLKEGDVIGNIVVQVNANGATLSLTKVGIYDSAGARLARSSDASSSFTAGAVNRRQAVVCSYTVTADGLYYLAFLCVGTTPPTLMWNPSGAGTGTYGANATRMALWTGQTDLADPATFTATSAMPWIAAAA